MEKAKLQAPDLPAHDSVVVLCVDEPGEDGAPRRAFRVGRGADLAAPRTAKLAAWSGKGSLPVEPPLGGSVYVFITPTRTYSEGFGGDGTSDIAPEDRALIRSIKRRHAARLICVKTGSKASAAESREEQSSRSLVAFDWKYMANIKEIFKSCMTRPNRQDYIYLATKSFGINLVVRVAFAGKAAMSGQLPVFRAVAVTSWYQLQDVVFTIFGQTYMKFLGKMTGLLRVGRAYLGDFFFVYFQMVGFEFLNRLVLGPIGENPLVYSWKGLSLIFVNILQGLISGGPLTPGINKMRRAGAISHSTLMHLYQLGGLTLQFGLFASFGYQKIYACLTGGTLIFAWGSFLIFSNFFPDPEFVALDDAQTLAKVASLIHVAA